VQRKELEKNNKDWIISKVLEIVNDEFEATEKFHSIYRDVINENVKLLGKLAATKETILLSFYLKICLNPYEHFQNINFDFNKFYEDNENLTEADLKSRADKQIE
jgi:serine/threonine-protein kinase ULK/ATG1